MASAPEGPGFLILSSMGKHPWELSRSHRRGNPWKKRERMIAVYMDHGTSSKGEDRGAHSLTVFLQERSPYSTGNIRIISFKTQEDSV